MHKLNKPKLGFEKHTNIMKNFKILFSIILVATMLYACAEQYEDPMGNEFKGTFVWKYSDTIQTKKREATKIDSCFIQIKEDRILTYYNALCDTTSSFYYALDKESVVDIFTIPLKKEKNNDAHIYAYYASYYFEHDTLFLVSYKVENNNINRNIPLIKRAYLRPRK